MAAINYRRKLLMLNEEDKGYGIGDGKKPTGLVKVETRGTKGVLTFLVQNLRDLKGDGLVYKGFAATADKVPIFINTGTIPVDSMGKGESKWRFDTANVADTGYSLDKLCLFGIIVYSPEDGRHNSICLTAGNIDVLPRDWKEILVGRASETVIDWDRSTSSGQLGSPTAQPENRTERTYIVHEGSIARSTEGMSEEVTKKPSEATSNRVSDLATGDLAANPRHETYIRKVLKSYPEVQPFERIVPGFHWWRINSYDYLFGIMNDEGQGIKYYVYGIPGSYQTQARIQMEAYGFYHWQPRKGSGHGSYNFGYWIAFVDAKTGKLAKPKGLETFPLL